MIKRYEIRLPQELKDAYPKQKIGAVVDRETFFITEYITRHLRTSSLKHAEIDNIRVSYLITSISSDENSILFSPNFKNIVCQLSDSYEDIRILRGTERIEKFLNVIEHSAVFYETLVEGLGTEIESAVDSFRIGNYKNVWIYKKKRLKGIGTAKLECELEPLKFNLSFVVENTKKQEIYRKRILQTRPDSIFYHSAFKDLILNEDKISITDRISEKPIFSITIDQIRKNKMGTFYPFQDFEFDESSKELVSNIKLHPRKTKWWDDFVACYKNTDSKEPCPKIEL